MPICTEFVKPLDGRFLKHPAVVANERDALAAHSLANHVRGGEVVCMDEVGLQLIEQTVKLLLGAIVPPGVPFIGKRERQKADVQVCFLHALKRFTTCTQ
jgi:hypothetical protein